MPYKDNTDYLYYKLLNEKGYVRIEWATFYESPGYGSPKGFEELLPENAKNGWEVRRAVKKWMKEHEKEFEGYTDLKIVRANGYWRDLHTWVYEIWGKKK